MATTAEIAARMLEILPGYRSWTRGQYSVGNRRCLIGARLDATGDLTENALHLFMLRRTLNGDAYTRLLARIIQAQYPDWDGWENPLDIVVGFNDHYATRFTDVRAVIEKAAAQAGEEAAP